MSLLQRLEQLGLLLFAGAALVAATAVLALAFVQRRRERARRERQDDMRGWGA